MTAADPRQVHQYVLESIDLAAADVEVQADVIAAADDQGPQRLANVRLMMAGRRRVIIRHAPHWLAITNARTDQRLATSTDALCARCRTPWPCDDYVDTAAGITNLYGDQPPGVTA